MPSAAQNDMIKTAATRGENRSARWFARAGVRLCALVIALAHIVTTPAFAQRGQVRDAEIETLLRLYATPIFQAAGLTPRSVSVHLINSDSINAFVAGGQRIFVHTGLLLRADTPNEVIGVLAHETGHIAGGHLTRMRRRIDELQTANIVAMLLGIAAVAGGALAGGAAGGQAGQGALMGGQALVQRSFLAYQRTQEASADQAAMKYLTRTKQSGKGMLSLFERLADQALVSLRNVDPYVLSHPMPRNRINLLARLVNASPHRNKTDSPGLMFRHKMMQAKLRGYIESAGAVLRRYPSSDNTMPAHYARAIAFYRAGELYKALPEINALIKTLPRYTYFHELKGQMLLESGKVERSIGPLKKAVALSPNSGLIRIMLAQAMLATENKKYTKQAISHLYKARIREPRSVNLYRQLAIGFAQQGKLGRAQLATAEAALLAGDLQLAKQQAKRAKPRFKTGSPEWIKANDILTFKPRKKSP